MKIHILIISSTKNGQTAAEEPVPFLFLGKARKALKQSDKESIKEGWTQPGWTIEKTPDTFVACEKCNYYANNYTAEIITKKIIL